MKILIADDSLAVRRGIVDILKSNPSWVVCAEAQDGAEAIEKASKLSPDVILLDVSMPGLSGLEVAGILREKSSGSKILVMSMHDPALLLPRALHAGAHACIDKSHMATDLVPAIEKLISSSFPQ